MIGTKLAGRYEVISELGRGGMGVVYKALDPRLDREVAIKLTSPGLVHADAAQRFRAEAQTVAKLDHPSIVPIHDIGEHEGALFFVMPVLTGRSLRHHLKSQSLTLKDILDGMIQTAEALDYSHGQGVTHRDIKPENLMVSPEPGGGVRFRLMDFGLARDDNMSRMTKSGVLVGTMGYMSPEQVMGRPIDGRSDIYSLGTVLYECLTGELPFSGEMQSILYRIVHEIPQSPRALVPDLDEDLAGIVLACLAKTPEERPQRAGDLAHSLHRYRDLHRESERMLSVMVTQVAHAPRPALSPFVGREKELRELQTRLNAAKTGECHFAVVSGAAGIGKTRLVDEIENLARAQHIPVLHGRFMEQDGAFPYHGFCELIQDFYRQRGTGSSSAPVADLSDLSADLIALFPMLSEIEDIRASRSRATLAASAETSGALETKNQIFELLARALIRLAAGKPLVLVLEDLHGAEISIEALQYIVRRLGPTATLLIGTYRQEELSRKSPLGRMIEAFQGDPRFVSVSLGPLAVSEHRKLLSTLLGGKDIDSRLAEQLYEGSEGNPFFAKELVRSLLDSESIVEDVTGAWKLSGGAGVASDELPETIQQAVEKRIAGLPDEMIHVLSTAALIGKSFDVDDLESLLGGDDDLDDRIDRLVQEGLIEEERRSRGDVMAFTSGVVREVLYAKLSRRKRRSLHRKYADLLEKNHTGRLERVYPQLVYHYAEGDDPEKTVEYGLLHAHRSLEAFSPEETLRAAGTALEFLDEEWEGDRSLEGEARALLARAHQMRGETGEGLREIEAAVEIFERAQKPESAVESILQAAQMAWQARRAEDAAVWVERGIAAARALDDGARLAEFLSLAATLANLRADYNRANEYLQEMERLRPGLATQKAGDEIPSGGRLSVPLVSPITTFDPGLVIYDAQVEVAANVFETLLTTDGEGRLLPLLCRDWTMAEGGRAFSFTLREGVRFHDGTPLTSERVKRSLEETIRLGRSEIRSAFSMLEGAHAFLAGESDEVSGLVAAAPGRLEIRLAEPLPIYPALLTDPSTGIALAGGEDTAGRTVGTGPFRFESRMPDRIVLARNEDYWNGPPRLEALEFRPGLTASAIAEGLRSGEFDLGRSLPPEEFERILREPAFRGRLEEAPGKSTFFILMNAVSGPLAGNAELRRALLRMVRVRDLVWHAKGRLAEPATGLIPPGLQGHDPGRRRRTIGIEEAAAMIAATGASTPVKLTAALSPATVDRHGTLLRAIFAAWSEAGVEVEVVTPTQEVYAEKLADPEGIDFVALGYISDYDDPDAMTYLLFNSETGRYRKLLSSPEGDELLNQARTEVRPETRVALYRRFETLLEDEGALLPLFHETNYRIPGPRVRGLVLRTSPPYANYREMGKAGEDAPGRGTAAAGKGTVRIPVTGDVTRTLDPLLSNHVDEAEVQSTLFETLTRLDEGARIVPWLASRIDVEDGGKRYRFRLRDGVRFHDGRRLSVRDVRFSLERALTTEACEFRWALSPVHGAAALIRGETGELEGFQIHSAGEFTIRLDTPVPYFPAVLSHTAFSIVPERIDFEARRHQDGCVGTGPFRLARFVPGEKCELERFPGYWREGYPRSEALVFERTASSEELYAGFRKGRFGLAYNLLPGMIDELRRSGEFAAGYREVPGISTAVLGLNVHRGPLRDPSLRRRLVAAVDRKALAETILGTAPVQARGMIPPGLLGHNPGSGAPAATAAPDADRTTAEVDLTACVIPSWTASRRSLMDRLAADLRRAGFRLTFLDLPDRDAFNRVQSRGESDLTLGAWVADYPDPHALVGGILDSREGWAAKYCGSPELDRMIERAQVEADPAARHTRYRELEEHVAREALLVPLFHLTVARFARPEVQGLTLSFATPNVRYENLRVRA
jgi:ABC-type transport system substrate-binding protein